MTYVTYFVIIDLSWRNEINWAFIAYTCAHICLISDIQERKKEKCNRDVYKNITITERTSICMSFLVRIKTCYNAYNRYLIATDLNENSIIKIFLKCLYKYQIINVGQFNLWYYYNSSIGFASRPKNYFGAQFKGLHM